MLQLQIRHSIEKALKALGQDIPPFGVDLAKSPEHGDFASNVAMLLVKSMKLPPRQIAEKLRELLLQETALFTRIEVAGPGFINLWLSNEAAYDALGEVLRLADTFGHAQKLKNQRVLIEFVSANPTGPLHLGHARSAFLGDAVTRLLQAAGYDVTREYYINDAGNQVATLGRSIYARYRELYGEIITLEKDAYPGEYVIEIAKALREKDGDCWLTKPEVEWLPYCIAFGIAANLEDIKAVLSLANISFDSWYSEATLHARHLVDKIIEDYRAKDMLYEAKQADNTDDKVRREESKAAKYADKQLGGTFLRTAQFGDEEDRIVLRADGVPVYLVADLAYHQDKFARGFDQIIDVFGADHAGHIGRLKAGMAALGLDVSKLDFLVVQMVRLLRDGHEVRFSKRAGQIYLLRDLLEEIGNDAARSIFLSRAPTTQFDFDLNQALTQSSDNPVFYVQYGHARMATLLRKAAEGGQPFVGEAGLSKAILERLSLPEELAMIKKMSLFPQTVEAAAQTKEPHRVLHYCQDLIGDFHAYFTKYKHSERIISADADLTQARLALVAALKHCLANALRLLGISAPDSMYHEEVH